jgi:hypothetical protein
MLRKTGKTLLGCYSEGKTGGEELFLSLKPFPRKENQGRSFLTSYGFLTRKNLYPFMYCYSGVWFGFG